MPGSRTGTTRPPTPSIYAWSREADDLAHTLAQALHDHAVDDALRDLVTGHRLVG